MTDYEKAWEDCAKYAHTLELENAKLKEQFNAELNAAKNDYERIQQLKTRIEELENNEEEILNWDRTASNMEKIIFYRAAHQLEAENEMLRERVTEAYIRGAVDYCRRESLVRADIDVPDDIKEQS